MKKQLKEKGKAAKAAAAESARAATPAPAENGSDAEEDTSPKHLLIQRARAKNFHQQQRGRSRSSTLVFTSKEGMAMNEMRREWNELRRRESIIAGLQGFHASGMQ